MAKLNYKQFDVSLEERVQEALDVNYLRPYIIAKLNYKQYSS